MAIGAVVLYILEISFDDIGFLTKASQDMRLGSCGSVPAFVPVRFRRGIAVIAVQAMRFRPVLLTEQ